MIFRLIKHNRLASLMLLPLLGLALWGAGFFNPSGVEPVSYRQSLLLPETLYRLMATVPYLPVISGFILALISAILVQRISVEFGFIKTRTLLPGIMFVLITGGIPGHQSFQTVYPSIIFMLLGIYRLFQAFDQRKAYSQVFDAAFLLGTGSLFYQNLVIMLPAFMAGSKILGRETRWRELTVTLTGFLVPWLFVVSWYYLRDQLPILINMLTTNFTDPNDLISRNTSMMIFLGFLGVLTLAGSYTIAMQYDEKKISLRQYFLVFFMMFLSSVASIVLIPSMSAEALIIAAIPISFLVTNMLLAYKKIFWGELILYVLLGLSIGLNFI